MSKPRVLILCTGNSCRSQMGEGWIRHDLGDRVDVHYGDAALLHASARDPRHA